MSAIFKRELRSFYLNMIGYLFTALLLFVLGVGCILFNLNLNYAEFEMSFSIASYAMLVLVPLITMRTFSEERASRTDQLLYSLPLRNRDVVLGKFFALWTALLIPIAISALYPLILTLYGRPALGLTYLVFLAFLLFGGALLSVGMFISAVTDSPLISAIISILAMAVIWLLDMAASVLPTSALISYICFAILGLIVAAVMWLLTKNLHIGLLSAVVILVPLSLVYFLKASLFRGLFPAFLSSMSLFSRFTKFLNGYYDLTALVCFISVIIFFNFLTIQAVEKRRWN